VLLVVQKVKYNCRRFSRNNLSTLASRQIKATDKIADGTITGADLSDGAIGMSTATVSGVLSTTRGGTGAASLTGFIKEMGAAAFTTES
jgi:hypothetical protein